MPKVIYLSPERRPAPHGKYWGYDTYEQEVCTDIAGQVAALLTANGFSPIIAEPTMTIRQRAQWANKNGVDFYLPIHTNASTDGSRAGTATGCEMLAYQHPASIRANRCIYDEIIKLYPSRRGLRDGNAYTENNLTEMVSAYIEIGFHDNPADAAWILESRQQIAEAITKGICAYYGQEYIQPEDKPLGGRSIGLGELAGLLRQQGIEAIRVN